MAGKPRTQGCRRTQQKNAGDSWGSQRPTLEEIIHKRLCKAAPAEICTENICTPGPCNGDEPTPGSQLLTGTVTGMRQKAKQLPGQEPRLGHPGRRLASLAPQADPRRWPVFHSCRDKMDIENLNCLGPASPSIPVQNSSHQETLGKASHIPAHPTTSPLWAALMGMA